MDRDALIENMIRWAEERLGETRYAGWCLAFLEDALEIPNGIEIFGGDSAKESAALYADAMRQGEPERGAFAFYDCVCLSEDGPVNWGHCGVSLGDGRLIHAWNRVLSQKQDGGTTEPSKTTANYLKRKKPVEIRDRRFRSPTGFFGSVPANQIAGEDFISCG